MSQQIRNAYTNISTPNKCTSALLSLMRKPLLKAHAAFVHGYHISDWNAQYAFLTAIDELTKTPGFRFHHMPVKKFEMGMQLKALQTNFLDDKDFLEYAAGKELVAATKNQEHLKMVESEFFKIALKSKDKHFN